MHAFPSEERPSTPKHALGGPGSAFARAASGSAVGGASPGGTAAAAAGTGGGVGVSPPALAATQSEPCLPVTPGSVRFAATTGAFGLSSRSEYHFVQHQTGAAVPVHAVHASPPSAGTVSTRRTRRPSLLSLSPKTEHGSNPNSLSISPKTHTSLSSFSSYAPQSISPIDALSPSLINANSSGLPSASTTSTHAHPLPRWGVSAFAALTTPSRVASAPPIPIEGLTTSGSPVHPQRSGSVSPTAMETDEGSGAGIGAGASASEGSRRSGIVKWNPGPLERRGSDSLGMGSTSESGAPRQFHGRPLPGALLATLISETSPLEHEMRSEARLQRLLSSHPSALTPRQRRNTRFTRGRFPEMVGDDDDEDDLAARRLSRHSRWMSPSSETDSDDMMGEAPDWPQGASLSGAAGAVNSAFASVMDLDRTSTGSWPRSDSGKSTPGGAGARGVGTPSGGNGSGSSGNASGSNGNGSGNGNGNTASTSNGNAVPAAGSAVGTPGLSGTANASGTGTPGGQWGKSRIAPSPMGLQLPSAFGTLAMGGAATPLGSPTVEMAELAGSPSTMSLAASPGMMQYREPQARPGKRKATAEERFDPYKRPRGSSPSPFQTASLSPSKPTAIPIPSSPSHVPLVTSSLAMGSPGYLTIGQSRKTHPPHPYTRPMSSRSRAASPALSIGSTSGVLSSSLGNGGLMGPSRPLAGPFIPAGQGANAVVSAASTPGAAPGSLGSLGLLSLAGGDAAKVQESQETQETGSQRGEAMEED